MEKQQVSYWELEGTYQEIGKQMAKQPEKNHIYIPAPEKFGGKEMEEAFRLYDRYCPGIREELEGYAQEAGIAVRDIAYTWMTYLVPGCSGLILTGKKTDDGHTKIARNYEFTLEDEDLKLYRTAPAGKYAHISGSIVGFGRTEGINEKGLAVSMTSCGFPVSNLPGMRAPVLKGLQFWAVIRSLLENCGDAKEALVKVMEMPIAYNMNLFLADCSGTGILFETMNGEKAYTSIGPADEKQYLCGTNHIVIEKLVSREPAAMENSIVRRDRLTAFAEEENRIRESGLRELLLKKYPEGMRANYYAEGFGTIKSVILDTAEKRYSICWLGQEKNGWTDYFVPEKRGGLCGREGYGNRESGSSVFCDKAAHVKILRKKSLVYSRLFLFAIIWERLMNSGRI